eukprot:6945425-Alexandrium_andersonii.AAC.1
MDMKHHSRTKNWHDGAETRTNSCARLRPISGALHGLDPPDARQSSAMVPNATMSHRFHNASHETCWGPALRFRL